MKSAVRKSGPTVTGLLKNGCTRVAAPETVSNASTEKLPAVPRKKSWDVPVLRDRGAAQVAADAIRQVMWDYCGIDRTAKGLRLGLAKLKEIDSRLPEGATEETNMVQTSLLIADAALLRRESRGGHYRSDFPRAKRKWSGRHIEW